jgi:hypothetical protein
MKDEKFKDLLKSLNQMKNIDAYKKIRKIWGIKPITKIKKSKKIYNRQKAKREIDNY